MVMDMRMPKTGRGWAERKALSGRKVADGIAAYREEGDYFIDAVDGEWLVAYEVFLRDKVDAPRPAPPDFAEMASATWETMGYMLDKGSRKAIVSHLRGLIRAAAPDLARKWRLAA